MADMNPTDRIFLRDAQCRAFDATVAAVDEDGRVALDATAFYATSGGQPHDTGTLSWSGGAATVTDVKGHGVVWHTLDGPGPPAGTPVRGELDWERRHALMRTHTALHILCGVIYNTWGVSVTGGNMAPLSARMDFEFDPLPEGFAAQVTELVNAEIAADRPIEISFLPRAEAPGRRRPHPHQGQPHTGVGDRRSGWSTSSGSTSRPTGAPTCPPPARWAVSRSSRPSRRAKPTSACASQYTTADLA